MPAGAISQLMGFIYNPDFKDHSSPLLKFRIGVSRYDFSQKKTVMDFFTITAFGKSAQSIHSSISNGANYICCFCDVKASKYLSKSGTPVEHVEFIIHDFRTFSVQKSSQQDQSQSQDFPSSQDQSSPHDFPSPNDFPQGNNLQDIPAYRELQPSNNIPPGNNPHNLPNAENNAHAPNTDAKNSLFPNSFSSLPDPF